MIEFHGVTILINRPVNLKTGFLGVGQIVNIALAKERLKPIGAASIAHVNGNIGQF